MLGVLTSVRANVIALIALTGCTGLIDGTGAANLTPEQQIAQQMWLEKALPAFKANCAACHAGTLADVGFLAGNSDLEIHDTLMKFDPQVVNLDAAQSSRVLTKGPHSGPALDAQPASDILEWITAEHDALGTGSGSGGPVLETARFQPLLCTGGLPGNTSGTCPINHVDLTPLGLPGATIDFVAQALSTDLYVTDLYLKASTDGTYVEHPLFVSYPADSTKPPIPDGLDRFFAVKMNLMGATGPVTCPPSSASCDSIGGGTAAFVGFTPTNELKIHFKVVDKYHPATGGSGTTAATGCKDLNSFKTNAMPGLKASCASCHQGTANPNAKAAMDLTGINATDDPTILLACDQARTRINFQTIDQSGFFIAPDPNSGTNHPFKFAAGAFQPFHDAVAVWANAEKLAP